MRTLGSAPVNRLVMLRKTAQSLMTTVVRRQHSSTILFLQQEHSMPKFKSALVVECIDDLAADGRGVWKVKEPLVYDSEVLGRSITVEPGFLTDFVSVPRLPIIYWLLGDTSHKAAVLHDWLFHHHEVCDETEANEVLLEACAVEGIPNWRRKLIYWGVVIGGRSSWESDSTGDGHTYTNGKIV